MMRLRLENKVAIVTGAAQGIGYGIAELFAAEGARVVIVDVNSAKVHAAAASLNGLGLACDVSKHDKCAAVVETVMSQFGRVDILVNNAGIAKDNLLLRMSVEQWNLVMDVNLNGAFNFVKACVRPMMKARYGRIVNIASIVGQEGNGGQANYAASKGGLIALTKSISRELASRGITANAVSPGFIKTPMTDVLPEEVKSHFVARIPLARMGEPRDVAHAVLFLSSDESSYITGQVLNVNGGVYT